MKDCERCGQAFHPLSKYGKICQDCKEKSIGKLRRPRIYTSKPYWKR